MLILAFVELAVALTAVLLIHRVRTSTRALHTVMQPRDIETSGCLKPFAELASQAIDKTLLPSADSRGVLAFVVARLEGHDSYQTVEELVKALQQNASCRSLDQIERLVKGLYQLHATLGIDREEFEQTLQSMVDAWRGRKVEGFTLASARLVRSGERVDRSYMMPISSGSHIETPLGVVLYDERGQILRHAKVFAE